MKKVIYPGTFDPITFGHIDIIKRASAIFDKVVVAVVKEPSKETMFTYQERIDLVKRTTKGIRGVEVEGFNTLVVEYARKKGIHVIVRGLRMISDFEYEFQMALTNRKLAPEIETIFLMPHPSYSYISARLVKEIAALGGDLRSFLPSVCIRALKRKMHEGSSRKNKI